MAKYCPSFVQLQKHSNAQKGMFNATTCNKDLLMIVFAYSRPFPHSIFQSHHQSLPDHHIPIMKRYLLLQAVATHLMQGSG